jgi:transposase
MEITAKRIGELEKSLGEVHDQRRQPGNLRHKRTDILAIAYTTLLCGQKDYEDMENLGREKEGWFRTFLELPNGIPDKNTFQRIFAWIKPVELMKSLQSRRATGQYRRENDTGERERGGACGPACGERLDRGKPLEPGQVKTEEKSSEITAIPELPDLVDIKGSTVTIDAADCNPRGARRG